MDSKRKNQCFPEINHKSTFNANIVSLVNRRDLHDVVFQVNGKMFYGHKVILALRSYYFQALLYGGLRESLENRVDIDDTEPHIFQLLFNYCYTGVIESTDLELNTIFKLLEVADKYGFTELQKDLIRGISSSLTIDNILICLTEAHYFNLTELKESALNFIDKHALQVVNKKEFKDVSRDLVEEMCLRDSFYLRETELLDALLSYVEEIKLSYKEARKFLMKVIRYWLIPLDDYKRKFKDKELIDFVEYASMKTNLYSMPMRGLSIPDTNLATKTDYEFTVVTGEPEEQFEIAFTEIKIEKRGNKLMKKPNKIEHQGTSKKMIKHDEDESFLEFDLNNPFKMNLIKFLAIVEPGNIAYGSLRSGAHYKRRKRELIEGEKQFESNSLKFSYNVEICTDKDFGDWIKVVDNSNVLCDLWQTIYFPPQMVKHIRINVTNVESSNWKRFSLGPNPAIKFHLVNFFCLYSTKHDLTFHGNLQKLEKLKIEPHFNVVRMPKIPVCYPCLISLDVFCQLNNPDGDFDPEIFSCHDIENPERSEIIVTLNQEYLIDTIKFLLYNQDGRGYGYKLEVATDLSKFDLISRRQDECSGEQVYSIAPRLIRYIRLTGTHIYNSYTDREFRVQHLEAYKSKTT